MCISRRKGRWAFWRGASASPSGGSSPPATTPVFPNISAPACRSRNAGPMGGCVVSTMPARHAGGHALARSGTGRAWLRQCQAVDARRRHRLFQPGPAKRARPAAADLPRLSVASRWRRTCRPFSTWTCRAARSSSATGRSLRARARAIRRQRFSARTPATDLPMIYASADVFVFPSRTDTFGIVLLEALASGLPVAAFPVTGPALGTASAAAVGRLGRRRARCR